MVNNESILESLMQTYTRLQIKYLYFPHIGLYIANMSSYYQEYAKRNK